MDRFLKLAVPAGSDSSSADTKHGPLVAHRRKTGFHVTFTDHTVARTPWLEYILRPIEVRRMLDIYTGNSSFANVRPHYQICLLDALSL